MNLNLYFGDELLAQVARLELTQSADGALTWLVSATLVAPTPTEAEQALTDLQSRVGSTGAIALRQGETVTRELAVADCRQGPQLAAVQAKTVLPHSVHAPREVLITFEAQLQNAAIALQSHISTVQVVAVPGQPLRLITRGNVVLRAGESPAAHEGAVIAQPAVCYRRVRLTSTRDAQVPGFEYETHDEQVFAPLPAGVDDGHVIRAVSTLPDGRRVQVTSGFFAGAGALARANELRPAGPVQGRVQFSEHTRRADFEFHELLAQPLYAGLLARAETVSYATTRRFVDHPVLGPGLPSWRQQVGAAFTEIVQEGSAVGETSHPSPPQALHVADVIERRVTYSFPDSALPADRRFVTQWRFLMRCRAERPAVTPEP